MVRIVKRGTKRVESPLDWFNERQFECHWCGCVFIHEASDEPPMLDGRDTPDEPDIATIDCPQCEHVLTFQCFIGGDWERDPTQAKRLS